MAINIETILERLKGEGVKTWEFFSQISPDAWERTVYTEGEVWTIRQVLAHLVASESGIMRLVKHIVGGGEGVPADFDLDVYNARKVAELDDQQPGELLEQFAHLRAQTLAMAEGLSPADFDLMGRHPFIGIAPVSEILKLMYRHNQLHQRDLKRLLK